MIALTVLACSKNNVQPTPPQNPPSTPTTSVTCANSTWKYEVTLGTPVPAGTFTVKYKDEYNNMITDTSITTGFSKTFSMQHTPPGGAYSLYLSIEPGPLAIRQMSSVNTVNDISMSISKDGNEVQTTGGLLPFCSGINPTCGQNTNSFIAKTFVCQ